MAFDWATLALQAINVLILAWILARFFYRPVAAIIEKRRVEAQKMLSDADASREAAKTMQAETEAVRSDLAKERENALAAARKEAETERAALLAKARLDAETAKAENEAAMRRDREEMEKALFDKAGALAVDIARRLLDRIPAEAASSAFVDSLCRKLNELPSQNRALIASAATRGLGFEVVSAAPLDEAQKSRCADALNAAAGEKIALSFRTDPALVAGVELSGPEIALANNWRNDLERILNDLSSHAEDDKV